MVVEVVGLDNMKALYEDDVDFSDVWKACKEPWSVEKTPYSNLFCLGRNLRIRSCAYKEAL
jgi:hypothetical protein